MSYTYEKSGDLVISGFDKGVGTSPHKGIGNLQGVNITSQSGEVMCAFKRDAQQQVGTTGTLTQVNTNTVSVSGIDLQVGQVITITDPGTTGLGLPLVNSVQALVVGGGGGGGYSGGGGGGGGYQYSSSVSVLAQSYSVTVGTGGAGGIGAGSRGANGTSSVFSTITSIGGGGGGAYEHGGISQGDNGLAGGSGGGAAGSNAMGTTTGGVGSQGSNGGAGTASQGNGGGGGATSVGAGGSAGNAGNGGAGTANSISGSSVTYAGGGGGGSAAGSAGTGGSGGGGNGASGAAAGSNGTANRGGGGGGGGSGNGGNGGSGIVIISYPTQSQTVATGGTITTSGGYTIHTFTTSGTFTLLPVGVGAKYYYLSTGKLYGDGNTTGSLPPSDPDSASATTGITSGTATFTITYPINKPIQSATEPYFDGTGAQQYRYYILDYAGQIWCHDTQDLSNWDTPVWFFVGSVGTGASGLAVFNGWLTVANGYNIYWKLTSLLGSQFVNTQGTIGFESPTTHFMLSGAQNTLYGTDGYTITSLFPNAALVGSGVNIQTYASYDTTLGSDLVTNGTFTGSATGWTLGAAWAYSSNAVDKNADGTNTLSQQISVSSSTPYRVTFTISNYTTGTVTPSIDGNNGTAVSANGTYTQYIYVDTISSSLLTFTPSNTSRFTIDSISAVEVTSVASIIGGSAPTTGSFSPRVPAIFFTDGTRPTAIAADTIYYIQWYVDRFEVFAAVSGGAALDLYTGATGNQYFNAFDPTSTAGQTMLTFTPQALVLPFYETAQCMAELGNNVIIGTKSNVVYPWNQVDLTPGDLIFLPENNVVNIITVNNTGYIFCGYNGNIYITNGSAASPVISVPSFCAGIDGNPQSYVAPYLVWGAAMYLEGRVYFSILDQTQVKEGNCGGVWSFVPTQNMFSADDTGMALRMENQNSYGTYDGVCTVLLADRVQLAVGPQYWSGWYSDITSPTYGIDYSGTVPQVAIIETDLIPTGTMLENKTFKQIEYKLSAPLASGETIGIEYRQNASDSYVSCGTAKTMSATAVSGYFSGNFEKGQWLQLRITLNPLASTSSSFCRLVEVRVR